jgi:HD-like signal output (HDOD) protein
MNYKIELEKLLESNELKLPIMPKVATKVLELVNNPNTNINQLSDIILQDQSIATHILRISNSAAFAPTFEIVSINQAISRLGFKLLSEITLSISLQSGIFNSKLFHNEVVHLWKFSLLTGLWAKRIAFHKKYNVEATFLGGLLHEIGKPIILNSLSTLIKSKNDFDFTELGIILEELHIKFAKKVMTDWKLPKLVSTISCDYFNLDESSNFYKESTVVYLAHKLSIYTFETLSLSKKEDNNLKIENLLKLPEWGKINYYRDEVEELITESETLLNTMNAMVLI